VLARSSSSRPGGRNRGCTSWSPPALSPAAGCSGISQARGHRVSVNAPNQALQRTAEAEEVMPTSQYLKAVSGLFIAYAVVAACVLRDQPWPRLLLACSG